MSHRRSTAWPVAAWLLALASSAVLAAGVYGEVLAPSVVLDLVSFWPGLVVAVLLALAVWPWRRRGRARISAVLPLLLLTWLWLVMALHLGEWELLPSAAADLEGPSAAGVERADLSVVVEGVLEVSADDGALYRVRPYREAGPVGVPEALERIEGDEAMVLLGEGDPGRWYSSDGWRVALSPEPVWRLRLEAVSLEVDLGPLTVRELAVEGNGTLQLPPATEEVPVFLEGRLLVTVPLGTAMEVTGLAEVPEDWVVTDTGWRSPSREPGYLVTVVEGSRVRIVESG